MVKLPPLEGLNKGRIEEQEQDRDRIRGEEEEGEERGEWAGTHLQPR